MSKSELLELTAKTLLNSEDRSINTTEFNNLINNATSDDEIDFYCTIYNFLLGKRQQEIIANEQY